MVDRVEAKANWAVRVWRDWGMVIWLGVGVLLWLDNWFFDPWGASFMCFTYPAWLIAGGIGVGLWVRRPGVVGRIMILVLAAAAWIPLGRIQSIAGNRRADRNFEYVMGSLQRGEVPRDNVLEEKSDPWPMFDEEMSYELVYQDTFFGDYDYSIILEDGRAYIFSFYEEKLGRWRVRIRLHDSGDKKPVDK